MSDTGISGEGMERPRAPTRGAGRRVVLLTVSALALIAAGAWSMRQLSYARSHVSSDNAQVDAHIVPVLAKVGGYIERVLIEDNQSVGRGALVVVVDDSELETRLAEAEANLAAARAEAGVEGTPGLVEAEASAVRARRQALEARLTSARAEQERASRDLVRIEELAGKQIASAQQLDAARAAVQAAEADASALQQEVLAARASESSAGAATRVSDARLARAEVALKDARQQLGYANVTAPVAGILSQTQVEVGQLIQAGQPLAAVVADSALWITANLKETEIAEVREGQGVDIDVDGYPGCLARGTVESLSPATGSKFALIPPDNATGNFTKVVQRVPVRIGVTEGCGEGRPLRPGMSVMVHIEVR